MEASSREKIAALLEEQYPRFDAVLGQYAWPHEEKRWHELVFCMLVAEGQETFEPPRHRRIAREAVDTLVRLDLLDVVDLAGLTGAQRETDELDSLTLLRRGVLERLGYPAPTVDRVLIALAETAHVLQHAFDGKIQKYLRRAGERMLREMSEIFPMSTLGEARKRYVFTHWLQNVANLPLALHNPSMLLICENLGVTPEDLCEIADEADLNVALLDDMAVDFVERAMLARQDDRDAA